MKLWITICLSFLINFVLGHEDDDILLHNCEKLLPGCECYDLGDIGGVTCWNASEFFPPSHLRDNSTFVINTTFEIIIEGGIKALPPNSVEGLIVYRLILDTPDIEEVDEKVFNGVIRLRRFEVRHSSLKDIPDFRQLRDSFQNLKIDNSLLTAIEGDHLKDLPLLTKISFYNNSISFVEPNAFEGTNSITVFDLSYNKLSFLPPHIFDPWKNLRKVALSHNQLLHVDNLFYRSNPQFIYLDFNNITDLDTVLHPNMANVTSLLISNNPIEQVTLNSFKEKVPNIKFLYLDHCRIREFDVRYYNEKLQTLDLSYNFIEAIPPQKINFGHNLELLLESNHLRDFPVEISNTVKRVYFANNHLENLGKILRFTQLSEVSVSKNKLYQLRVEDFQGVNGLNVLKLQHNFISWIDRLAFFNVRNDLQYLDLSCNFLTSMNSSMSFLSQLKFLNLSSNFISIFDNNEFSGLNELSELYLQNNRLMALGGQLQLLSQLQFLDVARNRIRTLTSSLIPKSLQYLYLSDNPLTCDCKLLPFIQWLNSTDSPRTDYSLCVPSSSNTSSDVHYCPEECQCLCRENYGGYFMAIDCSSRNLTILPGIFDSQSMRDSPQIIIDLKGYSVDNSAIPRNIQIGDSVGGVDFSNNDLQTLYNACLPVGLRYLHLHDNHFRKLPPEIMRNFPGLRRITLSGNSWLCDCDSVGFRKWILSKEDIITDINETRCGKTSQTRNINDRVIMTLDDRDLCPASINLYFSLGFGILAIFLVIAVFTTTYVKYEQTIKVWLYNHGLTWIKEREIDEGKQFDAFISYSSEDYDLVINQIIPVMENHEPKIELCLHYIHFVPGKKITDNANDFINVSRRTVVFLSRNYLDSEFCVSEFLFAHSQSFKDKVQRIVIVKLEEDLPEKIDPTIQWYLDFTTYLTWGKENFWENLFHGLPNSDQRKLSSTILDKDSQKSTSQLFINR